MSLDSLRLGATRSGGGVVESDVDDSSSATGSDLEGGGDTTPLFSPRERERIDQLQADRAALMGAAGANKKAAATGGTPSALGGLKDIRQVDGSIDRTLKALSETERFGQLTSAQLLIQRESFQRQRAQLSATNEYITRTKHVLTRMQFRVVTDKLVQGAIILVELVVIGAIVWTKYYRETGGQGAASTTPP